MLSGLEVVREVPRIAVWTMIDSKKSAVSSPIVFGSLGFSLRVAAFAAVVLPTRFHPAFVTAWFSANRRLAIMSSDYYSGAKLKGRRICRMGQDFRAATQSRSTENGVCSSGRSCQSGKTHVAGRRILE